ncbi:hypothetical protein N7G274_010893 [Stereocaulon virgatum]|uniref:Uncharacterized protein n=1 Tax=Stereocaulon virgatum TaxID=373712 RepID=A0ABR3ZUN8_9LECA
MTSTRWKPSWTTKSPTENQDTWSSGRGGLMTTISGCGKATWCTRPRCSKSSSKGKRQKANGTRSKIDHVSCQKAAQKTKTPKPPTHPTLNAHNLNAKTLNAKTHMLPNQNPRSVVLLVCHEGRQPILCILSGAPKEGRKTIAYLKTSHIHEILQRLRDLVQHDAGKEGGRNRTNPLGSREEPRMTEGIGERALEGHQLSRVALWWATLSLAVKRWASRRRREAGTEATQRALRCAQRRHRVGPAGAGEQTRPLSTSQQGLTDKGKKTYGCACWR